MGQHFINRKLRYASPTVNKVYALRAWEVRTKNIQIVS
jgi:hypothetical protein